MEEETKDLVNPYDKRKEKKSTADQNTNIITDYFKSKEDSGEKEQKQFRNIDRKRNKAHKFVLLMARRMAYCLKATYSTVRHTFPLNF